jgi:DNA-binding MarR family transcriptional regulator
MRIIVNVENVTKETSGVCKMLINDLNSKQVSKKSLVADIRDDIITGLKGGMILTLIEIAYNYPKETNHTSLCKNLGIPPSTLSNQINRLIDLDYLEVSNLPKFLYDARYKNFLITKRGISFLNALRGILDFSINEYVESDASES